MEKSREQFEEWFSNGYACSKLDEKLIKAIENVLWDVWKASRESLEFGLPPRQEILDDYDMYEIGFNIAVNRFKEILINNGVKVK